MSTPIPCKSIRAALSKDGDQVLWEFEPEEGDLIRLLVPADAIPRMEAMIAELRERRAKKAN